MLDVALAGLGAALGDGEDRTANIPGTEILIGSVVVAESHTRVGVPVKSEDGSTAFPARPPLLLPESLPVVLPVDVLKDRLRYLRLQQALVVGATGHDLELKLALVGLGRQTAADRPHLVDGHPDTIVGGKLGQLVPLAVPIDPLLAPYGGLIEPELALLGPDDPRAEVPEVADLPRGDLLVRVERATVVGVGLLLLGLGDAPLDAVYAVPRLEVAHQTPPLSPIGVVGT